MNSTIIRIAGVLEASPRGPLLRATDGDVWRVTIDEGLDNLFGQPVTVEGVRNGMSITAYYCALSDPAQR